MKINIHIECQDPEEACQLFTRLSGEAKAEPKAKAESKAKAEEVTKEELIVLGKQLCELTGGTQKALRSALDTVIEGEKISTCDASKYPAVKEAIEEAIAQNNL